MVEQVIIVVVTSLVSGFTAWFFARKKTAEQVKSMKIDNEIKSANYYKGLLDDLSQRLDNAIEELTASEERHRKLMKVNNQLVAELQKFKQLNGKST